MYPEVSLTKMSKVTYKNFKCDITDEDIDNSVLNLQKRLSQWEVSQEVSKKGDQVKINFVGKIDGEEFEGGSAEDFNVELGSKSMIDSSVVGGSGAIGSDESGTSPDAGLGATHANVSTLTGMTSLSPMSSPGKHQAGTNTPTKNARVLNNALENVFLFSLRPASVAPLQETMSGQQIKYMGTESVGSSGQMLNSNNLTEALMERLADAVEGVGSSVNYLVGSYKRILQKESTLHADIRTEFFGCKAQCINFIVTALTEPDTFSPNSDNSLTDLVLLLKDDTSPHMALLLKDLAEELYSQEALSDVISNIMGNNIEGNLQKFIKDQRKFFGKRELEELNI